MGLYEIPKLQCFDPEIKDSENHLGLQSLPGVFTLHRFSVEEARAETLALSRFRELFRFIRQVEAPYCN